MTPIDAAMDDLISKAEKATRGPRLCLHGGEKGPRVCFSLGKSDYGQTLHNDEPLRQSDEELMLACDPDLIAAMARAVKTLPRPSLTCEAWDDDLDERCNGPTTSVDWGYEGEMDSLCDRHSSPNGGTCSLGMAVLALESLLAKRGAP